MTDGYQIRRAEIRSEMDYLSDQKCLSLSITVSISPRVFDIAKATEILSREVGQMIGHHWAQLKQSPSVTVMSVTALGKRKIEGE